jgi:hypothetical protein
MMEKTNPASQEYADLRARAENIKKFEVKKDGNGNIILDKNGKPELTDKVIGGSWKSEDSRLKEKKNSRIRSYGKTVDGGTGLNWVAGKVLGKNTANNIAIGNAIRSTITEKSEKDKLYDAFKKAAETENPPPATTPAPASTPTTPASPSPKPKP